MSWVTPKTWSAVVVTVADLNQHIRDNLNILKTSISDDGTSWNGTANVTGGQYLAVRNLGSGNGDFCTLRVGNDTSAALGIMVAASSNFTTVGTPDVRADALTLRSLGIGGISLSAAHASGIVAFYSGGSGTSERRGYFNSDGGLVVDSGTMVSQGAGTINVSSTYYVGNDGAGTYAALTVSQLLFEVSSAAAVTLSTSGLTMATWPTTASAANANVANGAAIKLVTSLRANKHDIVTISGLDALHAVEALRPVFYRSAVDADQRLWPGFIAEDVEAVAPPLAVYGPDAALQSVAYDRVPAYLVAAVQALSARVRALETA